MGSIGSPINVKRSPILRSVYQTSSTRSVRSRLARFLLFEKFNIWQWILTAASFFIVMIVFQSFLPGSVVEENYDLGILEKNRDLEFGDGIRFMPSELTEKWERERTAADSTNFGRVGKRLGVKKAKIALIVADLEADGVQLEMVSVAAALKEIGYEIEVYSLKDGPAHSAWRTTRISTNIIPMSVNCEINVDWLEYNGIIVSSLDASPVISCFFQEPFKSMPIIWVIHEKTLALRVGKYAADGQVQLISHWKQFFKRAAVIVFPTHSMPMMYSAFDTSNYFVIPSSAVESWRADISFALQNVHDLRVNMGYRPDDFVIAIVGSQFSYSGMWLEYALVLQALAPAVKQLSSNHKFHKTLKIGISSLNTSNPYKRILETVALNSKYQEGSLQLIDHDRDELKFLTIANLVIYGSFLEEQSFPPVLLQAMSLGKLIIAPDLDMIKIYVHDKVNGFIYSKKDLGTLKQILFQATTEKNLSLLAQNIASTGRESAKNLLVSNTIRSYASLIENVIKLPSYITSPKAVEDIPSNFTEKWQWHLLNNFTDGNDLNKKSATYGILDKIEAHWNQTRNEDFTDITSSEDEPFSLKDWEVEKIIEKVNNIRKIEDEELKDRTDRPHGTWDEVYRSVRKADKAKNELHERDDKELERTGQPLCIYEPYFGEGTWPFLHNTSLYHGISLSTKGIRPGADDIDSSSRLPLLADAYYRDALGEYGAFFALANQIDQIHRNAWIGFQSWRASARKESLSKIAEAKLLEAIQGRRHGDALYFWVHMDNDPRNPLQQDFWSFCDTINAGNCRCAVSDALGRMYGIKLQHNLDILPKMPQDGDTWSVMHSWVLPTRSFLEFVMFSRMFVDAMDAQVYSEHHQSGYCYLSLYKDRHCYSRLLELLVNVWAYHSARRMVYVNPNTGEMQEQHILKSRKGKMLVNWFSYNTLKIMDEDLAEEFDYEHTDHRLWPLTGEVFWQGVYEREQNMRSSHKEKKRKENKDKAERIRKRNKQKTIGKYIKPVPKQAGALNDTKIS